MTIQKKFAFHEPSIDGKERANKIRQAFTALDAVVQELCPVSREKWEALRDIETAAMWAVKAVVLNDSASVAHE